MPKPLNLEAAVAADLNRTNPVDDPPEPGHREPDVDEPVGEFGSEIVLPGPPSQTPKPDDAPHTTNTEPSKHVNQQPSSTKPPASTPKNRTRTTIQVTIPSTVVAMLNAASASRSTVLRTAYNHHHTQLAEDLSPHGPMSTQPRRRVPPSNDPFEVVLFRLTENELALIDDTAEHAVVTRSLFVTELLRNELT